MLTTRQVLSAAAIDAARTEVESMRDGFRALELMISSEGYRGSRRSTRGPQQPAPFAIDLELRDGDLYIRPRAAPREASA